jgi:hypothetical protein
MKLEVIAVLLVFLLIVGCTSGKGSNESESKVDSSTSNGTSNESKSDNQFLIQECEDKSTEFDKETCYEHKAIWELKDIDYCQNAGRFKIACVNGFISIDPKPEYCEFKWLDKTEKEECYSLLADYSGNKSYCEKAGSLKEECIKSIEP